MARAARPASVALAEEADELSHLGERAPRCRLDGLERLARATGIMPEQFGGGVGLDCDDADRVRDDVVQLACDPPALRGHGLTRPLLALRLELSSELVHQRRALTFSP